MQALDMIKIESSHRKTGVLIIFLLIGFVFFTGSKKLSYAEDKKLNPAGTGTIVIDPGHGGYDIGAKGPDGSMEKEVALKLAQILAKELKPAYKVVLTRNGDYQVDLMRRASVANHHRGDVFISLHAGGGNRYAMDAWSVFYYQKSEQESGRMISHEGSPDGPLSGASGNSGVQRLHWNQIQLRHQNKSRALAGCMKKQLAANPKIQEVTVSGAALRVLEGVSMPAIIIETGYLTNPKTENRLNDMSFMSDVAKHIKKGVDVFLTR